MTKEKLPMCLTCGIQLTTRLLTECRHYEIQQEKKLYT